MEISFVIRIVRDRVIIGVHQCQLSRAQLWWRTQAARMRPHWRRRRLQTLRVRWVPLTVRARVPTPSRNQINWQHRNRTYQGICHQIRASIHRRWNRAEAKPPLTRWSNGRRWAAVDRKHSIDTFRRWPPTRKSSIVSGFNLSRGAQSILPLRLTSNRIPFIFRFLLCVRQWNSSAGLFIHNKKLFCILFECVWICDKTAHTDYVRDKNLKRENRQNHTKCNCCGEHRRTACIFEFSQSRSCLSADGEHVERVGANRWHRNNVIVGTAESMSANRYIIVHR